MSERLPYATNFALKLTEKCHCSHSKQCNLSRWPWNF